MYCRRSSFLPSQWNKKATTEEEWPGHFCALCLKYNLLSMLHLVKYLAQIYINASSQLTCCNSCHEFIYSGSQELPYLRILYTSKYGNRWRLGRLLTAFTTRKVEGICIFASWGNRLKFHLHLFAYFVTPCSWWITLIKLLQMLIRLVCNEEHRHSISSWPDSSRLFNLPTCLELQFSGTSGLTSANPQRCHRILCSASVSNTTITHYISSW